MTETNRPDAGASQGKARCSHDPHNPTMGCPVCEVVIPFSTVPYVERTPQDTPTNSAVKEEA